MSNVARGLLEFEATGRTPAGFSVITLRGDKPLTRPDSVEGGSISGDEEK